MSIICIHNALSAYRPRRWWMRPFNFIARCQSFDPIQLTRWALLNNHDVCIDFRFYYDFYLWPPEQPAHGAMQYRWPNGECFDTVIQQIAEIADAFPERYVYIRVILERPGCESAFHHQCQWLEDLFKETPNVVLFGGVRKKDWLPIYSFPYGNENELRLKQHVGSMASDARWYERFIPVLYARRKEAEHRRLIADNKSNDILSFDFLDRLI